MGKPTHAFVLALPKENVAEGIRRRCVALIAIECPLNKLGANHELLYSLILGKLGVLARVERFKSQK